MAWYAYCIAEQKAFHENCRVRRPFPIEGLKGVGGAQVIGYPSGEFIVIVSEYLKSGALTQTAALEHAHVVSECFKHGTVLPFKYATVFENEEYVRQAVRANRKVFMKSVAELRGKSEMHLKVRVLMGAQGRSVQSDGELPAAVGAEYLTKLRVQASQDRERQTKARTLSAQVHKLFDPIDEEVTCRHDGSGTLMIGITHLIDSESVSKYQSRFHTAAKQFRDCQMVVSGPYPPFHFLPNKVRSVHGDD